MTQQDISRPAHPENEPALKFYEKLGWQKRTKTELWKGIMEKQIT